MTFTIPDTIPQPPADQPATNGDAGPDVDAWFKAQRAELADEERKLAKAESDLNKALAKAAQARAAIRIYTGFIEGRSRGIAHTEKLLAKGDGK